MLSILNNIVLISAISAWLIAQTIKLLSSYRKNKAFDWKRLIDTGGMPSSHSALVVATASSVGLFEGIQSSLFAVTVVFASIVMYDAAGIRRAAGKHAKVINKMLRSTRVDHTVHELKELLGHTPLEVLAGAILGFSVAYALYTLY